MLINFTQDLQCEEGRRIISGKIVPFNNEIGATSQGKVIFEKGSIKIHDSAKIKLLLEHDPKQPIGRAINFTTNDDGIYASFKIAETTRGNDSLVEASQDLRSGLSIGALVEASEPRNGILYVQAASLQEVSLVYSPAYESAQVLSVAASEVQPESEAEVQTPETQQPESEASVNENATPETPEVEAAKVEASRPETITAVAYAKPRSPIKTAGNYLEHSIKAARFPGSESAQWIAAANDTMALDPGFNPTPQMSEIINGLSTGVRPAIDAISTGVLPPAGLSFEIPKITQIPVSAVVAEEGALDTTSVVASYITVPVQKFGSMNTISTELLDRSSPLFYDEYIRLQADAYATATDTRVLAILTAGGALNATPTAITAAGLVAYVSSGSAAVYAATHKFARSLVVSPDWWSLIMGFNDAGRPIYNAQGATMNAAGVAGPTSLVGNVMGLSLYVDPNLSGTADNSAMIIDPTAYTFYEAPTRTLTTNIAANGQVQISYYGYAATATKIGAGCNRFNFT